MEKEFIIKMKKNLNKSSKISSNYNNSEVTLK